MDVVQQYAAAEAAVAANPVQHFATACRCLRAAPEASARFLATSLQVGTLAAGPHAAVQRAPLPHPQRAASDPERTMSSRKVHLGSCLQDQHKE